MLHVRTQQQPPRETSRARAFRLHATSVQTHHTYYTHYTQGVDLVAGGRNTKTHRTAPKSDNVYLKLLVKVRREGLGVPAAGGSGMRAWEAAC